MDNATLSDQTNAADTTKPIKKTHKCGCKAGCKALCGCKKAGIGCGDTCNCKGSCQNLFNSSAAMKRAMSDEEETEANEDKENANDETFDRTPKKIK